MMDSGKWNQLLKMDESSLQMNRWSSCHPIPKHDLTEDELYIAKHVVISSSDTTLNDNQIKLLTDACLYYVFTYYEVGHEPDLSDCDVPVDSELKEGKPVESCPSAESESNKSMNDPVIFIYKHNEVSRGSSIDFTSCEGFEQQQPTGDLDFTILHASLTDKTSTPHNLTKRLEIPLSDIKNTSPLKGIQVSELRRNLFGKCDDLEDTTNSDDPSSVPTPIEVQTPEPINAESIDHNMYSTKFKHQSSSFKDAKHRIEPSQETITQAPLHLQLDENADTGEHEASYHVEDIIRDINRGRVDHLLHKMSKAERKMFWKLRVRSAHAAAHYFISCLEEDRQEDQDEGAVHTQRYIKKTSSQVDKDEDATVCTVKGELWQECTLTKSEKECGVCGKDVVRLKRHMIQVHKMSEEDVARYKQQKERKKNTRPLKDCPVRGCYSRVQRLDQHLQRIHKKDPQVSKNKIAEPQQLLRIDQSSSKMNDLRSFKTTTSQPSSLPADQQVAEEEEEEEESSKADEEEQEIGDLTYDDEAGVPTMWRDDATVTKHFRRAGFLPADEIMMTDIFKEELAAKHVTQRQMRHKLSKHPESKVLTDRFSGKQIYDKLRCLMKYE